MSKKFIRRAVTQITASLSLFAPLAANAVFFDPAGLISTGTGLGSRTPEQIAISLISIVLGILSIVAIILIIYGGVVWMTAAGDETKVEKAQGILKASFIGLLIVVASYGIANYVFSIFETATGL